MSFIFWFLLALYKAMHAQNLSSRSPGNRLDDVPGHLSFTGLEGIWIFFHPLPSDLVAVCRADTFDVAGFCKFLCVETMGECDVGILEASGVMREVNQMSQIFQHPWCLDDPCTDPFSALPHFQEMSRFNRLLSQMTMTLKQLQKADIVRWKTATNSWLQLQDTWIFPQLGVGKKGTLHNDVY